MNVKVCTRCLEVVLVLFLSLPGLAWSGSEFDEHIEGAVEAFQDSDYALALQHFEAAYALEPRANLLYNMARAAEQAGQIALAVDYYSRFVVAPEVEHEARKDAIDRLKTLKEVLALTGGGAPETGAGGVAPAPQARGLNLNTATESELIALPGIGKVKARAIVEDRTTNGQFTSVDDVTRVHGIGQGTLKKIRDQVYAGPATASGTLPLAASEPTPENASDGAGEGAVNFNTATQAELQSVPGIGQVKAQSIIDERTSNGPFTSCDDLQRVNGIGPATVKKLRPYCRVK